MRSSRTPSRTRRGVTPGGMATRTTLKGRSGTPGRDCRPANPSMRTCVEPSGRFDRSKAGVVTRNVKLAWPRASLTGSTIDNGGAAKASPAAIPVKKPQIRNSRGVLMLFLGEPFYPRRLSALGGTSFESARHRKNRQLCCTRRRELRASQCVRSWAFRKSSSWLPLDGVVNCPAAKDSRYTVVSNPFQLIFA